MSTHDPNDLRDTRVDAAWRAASREEPPAALDDTIRAAARRETSAGPRSTEAKKAGVPESLRPERWWWPLAAAATIGAIAVGLLQLVEPDQVGAPGADKAVVSDTPAPSAQTKKQDVAPRAEVDAPKPEQAARQVVTAPAAAPASTAAPAAPPPSPRALRKDAAVPFPRDEGAAAVTPPAKPSAPEERTAANTAVPAPPVAQPFPADALKRESKETAMRDAAPAAGIVAPLPAPAAESDVSGFSGKRAATPASSAGLETTRAEQAGVTSVMASKGAPKALPTTRDKVLAREPVADAGGGTADAVVDARAKTAPKLPVPEWIALIRRLRDEGRTDEAEKELAAFRTAYADHERILPPDLRDWKPAAR